MSFPLVPQFLRELLANAFPGSKPSTPEPFGYKNSWIVVKSTNTAEVVKALGLKKFREADWQDGLDTAERGSVLFVTPPVYGWVAIVGVALMNLDSREAIAANTRGIEMLSEVIGEAQAFASHRVVEFHVWLLAQHGKVVRKFAYIGEAGEVLEDMGSLTAAETALPFDKLQSFEWFPSESDVMRIAAGWSFDPTTLSAASGPRGRGVLVHMP